MIETRLTLVTAPIEEPVSLEEAKLHCRVDVDDDDPLIERAIKTARRYAEAFTRRHFITATYALRMDTLPSELRLPLPPLVSVSSITYVDLAGATQTLSSSLYTVNPYGEPGRIVPAYNQTYPSVRGHVNDVIVTFVAGYGAASAVPEQIKSAMLLLIDHYYENREAAGIEIGGATYTMPLAVDALLGSVCWGSYA